MKSPAGWERILLFTLFITLSLFFMTQTPASAFGPAIVDVTTKAFSAVWTTGGPYTSCGINLYTSSSYSTPMSLDPSQIIEETASGNPGQDGKQYGIAKVTVVGLDVGTKYYFRLKKNGGELPGNYNVTTEKLRGLDSTDPNKSDIVSNDIVHKAVYKSDGTSPGIGALVLGTIYAPDGVTVLSDYPISAWVGDGMIGDESEEYNPNSISYKQYAALNMNNLFSRTDNYPLSLEGDDPATPDVNESEIIEFTIVHGTQSVLGGTTDNFTSYGLIEHVEKSGGEKITTAKVLESFNFKVGLNSFTFPFSPPNALKAEDLWLEIEAAGGEVNILYVFKTTWVPVMKITPTYFFNGDVTIGEGEASLIIMDKAMNANEELSFYGDPLSSTVELVSGINIFSIPQCPAYTNTGYQTKNMWLDIEALEGVSKVIAIYTFLNPWAPTVKITPTYFFNSLDMISTRIYYVNLELDQGVTSVNWDPFP
jgi:hypothetical protein